MDREALNPAFEFVVFCRVFHRAENDQLNQRTTCAARSAAGWLHHGYARSSHHQAQVPARGVESSYSFQVSESASEIQWRAPGLEATVVSRINRKPKRVIATPSPSVRIVRNSLKTIGCRLLVFRTRAMNVLTRSESAKENENEELYD
jgi:hypothetical protein